MIEALWTPLALSGAAIWVAILVLPWLPWLAREALDAEPAEEPQDLSDVTVLIPARDEAPLIGRTLRALAAQGAALRIILIDDQSTDGTSEAAREVELANLTILSGEPLPAGWSGKLWALEQGRGEVKTRFTLLLDADIELDPGLLPALKRKMDSTGASFISIMASLRMAGFWESLLLPAFVYFFKLLYPFRLANGRTQLVAAAAGGCVLVETRALADIGGFAAVRGELIDDCALARAIKRKGYRTWIGLTRSASSIRRYPSLATIWNMVARTAYTELRYSPPLLILCTVILVAACWLPIIALVGFPTVEAKIAGAVGLAAMALSYAPTLGFYRLSPIRALTMPVVGTLFLAMTWTSAIRYWQGRRSQWKGRIYTKALETPRRKGGNG